MAMNRLALPAQPNTQANLMTVTPSLKAFAASLEGLTAAELRRQLIMERDSKRLGLVWEQNSIEKDKAVNSDVVLPR